MLQAMSGLLERLPSGRPTLAVLTYHRVGPARARPDLHPALGVEPAAFEAHMQLISQRAHPVSIDDVLAAAGGGDPLPPRAVHVTFDDAYQAVEDHAWPVLRRLGVPATMFVPTQYPDQDRCFWWDRLSNAVRRSPGPVLEVAGDTWSIGSEDERARVYAALREQVAALAHPEAMALVDDVVRAGAELGVPDTAPATSSWSGLLAMAADGLALAVHSRNHPFLDRIPPDDLHDEISGSFDDLRTAAGPAVRPAIAYPGGAHGDSVVAAARRAGMVLGFTTDRGVVDLRNPDWLRLPRINVGCRTSAPLLRVQLTQAPHRARAISHRALARVRPPHRPTSRSASWN